METEPQYLRERAEWFQRFAECAGSADDRQRRLRIAGSLYQRAAKLERQRADANSKTSAE